MKMWSNIGLTIDVFVSCSMVDSVKYINKNPNLLKDFINEFFDFHGLLELGFFTKEMKGDYKAQAKKICDFFGMKTIYEYRAEGISAHISYTKGHRPEGEGFITEIPSIY